MIKHIAFFAYPVSNLERSRKFYEGVLGLRVSMNFQDAWIEYDIAGVTLAITTMIKELKPGAPGGFIGLEVDDIDLEVERLKSKGAVLKLDTFDTPGCRIAVFADPDGNGINLHQMKPVRSHNLC
jgi:predicted enzyme related to lactoylglutathione lyase